MSRNRRAAPEMVIIRLTCILSGGEMIPAGTVFKVDADEANRLISIGAAVLSK